MDYMQKIQYAANSFYNRGLELARERDLSGAAECLKRALQFNKYHTDARNLLDGCSQHTVRDKTSRI